jgi:hypothetical protein
VREANLCRAKRLHDITKIGGGRRSSETSVNIQRRSGSVDAHGLIDIHRCRSHGGAGKE